MKLSKLLAPRMDLKYVFLALFVYLAITVVQVIGPANFLQSTAALDFGVAPQSVSASTHVVFQIPEVQIPAARHIIVGPAKKTTMANELIIIIENPEGDVESSRSLWRSW